MYIPPHFRENDKSALYALMKQYSFATLVTQSEEGLFASHLPFLLDPDRGTCGILRTHMARANPQWRQFTEEKQQEKKQEETEQKQREALVIFQGPHAYISPAWYTDHPSVPTWNYAVIHAYGRGRLLDDAEFFTVLKESVERHEAHRNQPWSFDSLAEDYVQQMMRAIVGFEIEITRLEGKTKMSQNRSADDQKGVIEGLLIEGNSVEIETANWMQAKMGSAI